MANRRQVWNDAEPEDKLQAIYNKRQWQKFLSSSQELFEADWELFEAERNFQVDFDSLWER